MISQCLNPNCLYVNIENTELCQRCNSQLLLMNRYRAVSVLGQGGFGRTFLAIDEFKPSKPRCVIKQFLPEVKTEKAIAKATELFEREASRLDELGQHEQIPSLLAFFDQEERKYLVQEYVDGEDLLKVLIDEGVFSQQQIKELLKDLLDVLKFVHDNNVIHRDIKPENIIRRKDGKLVLVDFGAAKETMMSDTSQVGTIIGSISYIAPEQATGKAQFASDLYSLGATCLHLLTGVEPIDLFDTEEGKWNWRSHLQDRKIDYELSCILDKLVESATKKRFQSAIEVERALADEVKPKPIASLPKTTPKHSLPRKQLSSRQHSRKLKEKGKSDLQIVEFQYTKISDDPCMIMGRKIGLSTSRSLGKAKSITLRTTNGITIDLIGIPGGKFLMGSPESELERQANESPQHFVKIKSFLMAQYPITQAQWWAVMNDNPSGFSDANVTKSKKPVERVSWHDCILFCKKLAKLTRRVVRLPTEAEWEYACRGQTTTAFHFGVTISTDLANYNGEDIYGVGMKGRNRQQTTDVDCFSANSFGLYDLHGNVAEWCADTWHFNYQNAPKDGSVWVSGYDREMRVLRGGSWQHSPGSCRSAYRLKATPHERADNFGFRIALSI